MKTASSLLVFILSLVALPRQASAQEPRPQQPPPKPQNEFNPTITVFHDMVWRLDNKNVIEIEDGEVIDKDDKFLLRETEVDLRTSIDPYADGVLIVALEQEVPGAFEVDAEEAYVRIKSLPFGFWEEPPLGTRIKAGRFLAAVGRQNRLHTHDLPQTRRGLAFENFIGEHGFIANGVSTESFLPMNLSLTLEALQGGGWEMGANGTDRPQYIANLSWFNTFGDEHDVEITGIALYGSNDPFGDRQVHFYSLDFLYKWKPRRQGEWTSLVVSGQVYYGSSEFREDLDTDGDGVVDTILTDTNRAIGYFAYVQYQIDRRWYVGVRYDWTEDLEDRPLMDDEAWRVNPYLSCYLSEFFRLRAGYEFTSSDNPEDDDLHTFLLELTVVFGSHPPHPYWVNQ
jgi:hypothetical protein